MKTRQLSLCAAFAALITVTASLSSGQQSTASPAAPEESDTESQTEKLAKETQNPVANLISVPFQNNFNFGIGSTNATRVPLTLSG